MTDIIPRTVHAWQTIAQIVAELERITGDLEHAENVRRRLYALERRLTWLVDRLQPTERKVQRCERSSSVSSVRRAS